jgi:hypothetical protein
MDGKTPMITITCSGLTPLKTSFSPIGTALLSSIVTVDVTRAIKTNLFSLMDSNSTLEGMKM